MPVALAAGVRWAAGQFLRFGIGSEPARHVSVASPEHKRLRHWWHSIATNSDWQCHVCD
jgi:hypothetical protein